MQQLARNGPMQQLVPEFNIAAMDDGGTATQDYDPSELEARGLCFLTTFAFYVCQTRRK